MTALRDRGFVWAVVKHHCPTCELELRSLADGYFEEIMKLPLK
jgi:hypothetical protein